MKRAEQMEMNKLLKKRLRDMTQIEWKRFWELHRQWVDEIQTNLRKERANHAK